MNIFETLAQYLGYSFVQYALVVGILIALCSSLLGVTLVLKRYSFIGDGLSHVAFGAMAVAGIAGLTNDTVIVLPVTVVCAVILLRGGTGRRIMGDAAVAMISVGALAVGYLLLNIFSTSSNLAGDVCTVLFGTTSILTLTQAKVWLCTGISVAVILLYIFFYNKIFAVTFDETFARATGVKTQVYNVAVAVIIAVVIVLAMELVGALLISALVIFPALAAMRVFKRFRAVVVCSAVLSVTCAALGILASIIWSTPVGSTIVAGNIFAFALFYIAGLFTDRRKKAA